MKVVVAIDSFKGSLTSMRAVSAAREGILRAVPDADVVVRPSCGRRRGYRGRAGGRFGRRTVTARVTGPLGEPVECAYGILPDQGMAILEIAGCCGLTLVPEDQRDPRRTTTYGLGELIRHAMDRGCRAFLIGIGGSATNNAGLGMLTALGFRFFTQSGERSGISGDALQPVRQSLQSNAALIPLRLRAQPRTTRRRSTVRH